MYHTLTSSVHSFCRKRMRWKTKMSLPSEPACFRVATTRSEESTFEVWSRCVILLVERRCLCACVWVSDSFAPHAMVVAWLQTFHRTGYAPKHAVRNVTFAADYGVRTTRSRPHFFTT